MGSRTALIVANDAYEHEGLRHLVSPAADAEALAGVLGDEQIGDFAVRVVRNEPAHAIELEIEDLFSEARTDDVLLVHFSCHGLKNEAGELFFAAPNTRPNRLGSTAVSADFIQRCMRASRSQRIVLLLDCCYGGAFGQGVAVRAADDVNVLDAFPGRNAGGGRGRAVITASSAMEYAFEGDRLTDDHSRRPSVFTAALVEGLATGDADRDEDGFVSLNELYGYVFDRVTQQNPHQTPTRDIEGQGDLHVARSRRRRIAAQPIPSDLAAATVDQNMYARMGAVNELRARLLGDNLAAAVGAREALAGIVERDIQYVAGAAADALAAAVPRADAAELDLGLVERDTPPVPRTVRLLGPPVARAGTVRTSASWIRVVEVPAGLEVSVDTAEVGARRGTVEVTAPTGSLTITVEVEVTERAPAAPRQREPATGGPVPVVTPVEVPVEAAGVPDRAGASPGRSGSGARGRAPVGPRADRQISPPPWSWPADVAHYGPAQPPTGPAAATRRRREPASPARTRLRTAVFVVGLLAGLGFAGIGVADLFSWYPPEVVRDATTLAVAAAYVAYLLISAVAAVDGWRRGELAVAAVAWCAAIAQGSATALASVFVVVAGVLVVAAATRLPDSVAKRLGVACGVLAPVAVVVTVTGPTTLAGLGALTFGAVLAVTAITEWAAARRA